MYMESLDLLGQWIEAKHKLQRKFGEKSTKFWSPKPFKTYKRVMVIGIRTLSDGIHHCSGYGEDYESYYEPKTYFKVLLVVADLKTNPFYILYEEHINA